MTNEIESKISFIEKGRMKMTTKELELAAFRMIRRETRRFDRETNNSELGNYVRGVVDLETELYEWLINNIHEEEDV